MEETTTAEDVSVDTTPEAQTEGGTPEVAPKTYTQEEVEALTKKLQSDSERGVQKLIKEKKNIESVLEVVGKVSSDESYLVKCYEENPEVAKIILDKYYSGMDIDAFKVKIGYSIDYNDPETRKHYFELEANRMAEQKLAESAKASFIEKLKMNETEKTLFEEAFEERKQLKSFKISDIEKHLEKAYREVSDTGEAASLKLNAAIANSLATSGKDGGGGNDKPKPTGLQDEIAALLRGRV